MVPPLAQMSPPRKRVREQGKGGKKQREPEALSREGEGCQ